MTADAMRLAGPCPGCGRTGPAWQRIPNDGGVVWVCPECGYPIGFMMDGGQLDLGIVRREDDLRRNEFTIFSESFDSVSEIPEIPEPAGLRCPNPDHPYGPGHLRGERTRWFDFGIKFRNAIRRWVWGCSCPCYDHDMVLAAVRRRFDGD